MKTAAALGLAAMLMAGTAATAQTAKTAAPAAPQPLGDLSGSWALFWAVMTDTGAVVSFTGAMDVARADDGAWDIALANYVLDTEENSASLVNARQQCRGVEADGTVTVTCEVTETTAGRYPPEVFTLTRSSPTLLTGTLRESGGSDLEGLEALKVR